MTNQTNVVPLSEDFKKWLIQNNGKVIQEDSAASTVSRLNGLFTKVLNPAFNKTTKKDIRPFHEILEYLISYDIDKAIDAIVAISECAFDAKAKGQSVGTDESYNDRRSALNRYKEFLQDLSMNRITERQYLNKFINKYAKKVFTKKDLYTTIISRRKTEDRLSGTIFYPIKLIYKILKENGCEAWIKNWLEKLVDNIDIIINTDGTKRKFKDLADAKALEIESTHKVRVWFKDESNAIIYTHDSDEEQSLKTLKLATLESMHIDHVVAISNLLKTSNYPALSKLTETIKNAEKELNKTKYVEIYNKYKNDLNQLVKGIKEDLSKLSEKMELEVMEGHANIKKSNKY